MLDVVAMVHSARAPHSADRFPALYPVHPQPWWQAGLLVATPCWDMPSVVFFDCSGVDGGTYSLAVPPRVTRRVLLMAADIEETSNFEVYVRTMPWPVPHDYPVELRHGDLIQIVPANTLGHFHSDLAAMLRGPGAWDPAWGPPGDYDERAWIIADDRQFCFHGRT